MKLNATLMKDNQEEQLEHVYLLQLHGIVIVLAVIFISPTEHSAAYTDQFERQVCNLREKVKGMIYIVDCCCEHARKKTLETKTNRTLEVKLKEH